MIQALLAYYRPMAGLEGIDASRMDIVDALGAIRYEYDDQQHVARPLLRHLDFLPVAIARDDGVVVERLRFGLPGFKGRIITNARDDKLTTAATWKSLLPNARCLTAISYVVERDKSSGTTYRIQRRDGALMVVPGLYARRHYRFSSTGNEYDDLGHVQITTDANDLVSTVHDRFVCELDGPRRRARWLDPGQTDLDPLLQLLAPASNQAYEMVPIAPDVWKRRQDPDAVAPTGQPVVWNQD